MARIIILIKIMRIIPGHLMSNNAITKSKNFRNPRHITLLQHGTKYTQVTNGSHPFLNNDVEMFTHKLKMWEIQLG